MKIKRHNISKSFLIAVFAFAIIVGFGFLKVEKAKAGWCVFTEKNTTFGSVVFSAHEGPAPDSATCNRICNGQEKLPTVEYLNCKYFDSHEDALNSQKQLKTEYQKTNLETATGEKDDDVCKGLSWSDPKTWFNCILLYFLRFVGWLLSIAATIFTAIINPKQLDAIINNGVIYQMWVLVRDTLNIGFILVLLFSAFATIFQVESFNYKKILLKLVIMALLVNFSYPIARVIIDFSNGLMYYFLNSLPAQGGGVFDANAAFGKIAGISNLQNITYPSANSDTTYLIAAIIFTFILAVTFLMIAILFVIRTVALALLIIFSPIAFVGSILPMFKKEASQWWNMLFKYSFFGPIMIFMLYLSVEMMRAINLKSGSLGNFASAQSNNPGFIASASFYTIPVVILWIGMGVAQSMSIAGAGVITGQGKKFMGWAGKTFSGYRAAVWTKKKAGQGAKYAAKAGLKKFDRDYIGVRAAIKAWKDRAAEVDTDKVSEQSAKWRDKLSSIFEKGKRDPNFYKKVENSNKIAKYKKEQDLFSKTDTEIIASLDKLDGKKDKESGQRTEAFMQTLAENKDLNEFSKDKIGRFDPYGARIAMYTRLRSNLDEAGTVDALHKLEDTNLANGVFSLYGLTHVLTAADVVAKPTRGSIGQRVLSMDAEQRDAALVKMKQIDYQKFMINFHRDSAITEDATGNTTGLSDIGIEALKFINSQGAKYSDRLRGENKAELMKAINIQETLTPGFKASIPTLVTNLS